MNIKKRNDKIIALTHAKDYLEKGLSCLIIEGYDKNNDVYKRAKCSIDLLRMDIVNLQTGIYPFAIASEA